MLALTTCLALHLAAAPAGSLTPRPTVALTDERALALRDAQDAAVPVTQRWYFWLGLGAGALVIATVVAAVVMAPPPQAFDAAQCARVSGTSCSTVILLPALFKGLRFGFP